MVVYVKLSKLTWAMEEAHDDEVVHFLDLNQEEWYHLVFIKDESSLKLYVNGDISESIVDNHGAFSITDGFLEVGAPNYWNGGWSENGRAEAKWHGNIDDVRFYNIAIAENEINNLYCEGGWCVYGCTDPEAINYNPDAHIDD